MTYAKFLSLDMTIALKSLNETQQTVSIRLTIIPHDISVIYVTYFQMYRHVYPLDNDSTLDINHTKHLKISTLF